METGSHFPLSIFRLLFPSFRFLLFLHRIDKLLNLRLLFVLLYQTLFVELLVQLEFLLCLSLLAHARISLAQPEMGIGGIWRELERLLILRHRLGVLVALGGKVHGKWASGVPRC